jgi:dihydroorotate dehydrogenase electron transfer subunit
MLRGDWGRDPVLPRAYSVLDVQSDVAEFLIRRVGRGSGLLAGLRPDERVTVLGPLGNWFPEPTPDVTDLLVAGGCGFPPLYLAGRRAADAGQTDRVEVLMGARRQEEIVLLPRLAGRGVQVRTIVEEPGPNEPGLVTDLLERRLAEGAGPVRILSCGPEGMLRAVRAVARRHEVPCYLSLEAAMACGLGACLGCAVEAAGGGYVHVCSDGPVFDAEEVWP